MLIAITILIYFILVSILIQKIRKKFPIMDRIFKDYSGTLCIFLFALFIDGIASALGGDSIRKSGMPGMFIGVMGLYFCFSHWNKTMLGDSSKGETEKKSGWFITSALSGIIFGFTVFNSKDRFENTGDFGSSLINAVLAHLIVFHLIYNLSAFLKKTKKYSFFSKTKFIIITSVSILAYIYAKLS